VLWGTTSACLACLLTPEVTLPQPSDAGAEDAGEDSAVPTYSAAIVSRVTIPNLAGCIELTDQSAAGLECATVMQAAWRCEEFACNPTCPVTDNASENAYFACTQAAAATVCSSYAGPAATCLASEAEAGVVDAPFGGCFGTDPVDQMNQIATFFCNS